MCAWIWFSEIKCSQLKINHLNDTSFTKADGAVSSTKAFGGGMSVVCLTRTSRYRSKRRSWLVPLLPTFSWLMKWEQVAGRASVSSVEHEVATLQIILIMLGCIFWVQSFFDSSWLTWCRISFWRRLFDSFASLFWAEMAAVSCCKTDVWLSTFAAWLLVAQVTLAICWNPPCEMQAWCCWKLN